MGEDRRSNIAGQPVERDPEELEPGRGSARRPDLSGKSLADRDVDGHEQEDEDCPVSEQEGDDPRLAGGP